MSSDIDEEDYSSMDSRDAKMEIKNGEMSSSRDEASGSDSPVGPINYPPPAYVNLTNSNFQFAQRNGMINDERVSKREKSRHVHVRRKSRSRERPRGEPPIGAPLGSPVNTASLTFSGSIDPERIRERERELEKIHRRSRELMLSPRILDSVNGRSREGSMDRMARRANVSPSGVPLDGWKPAAPGSHHHLLSSQAPPPPLPPRLHSPSSTNGHSSSSSLRYKSPSPTTNMRSNANHHTHPQQGFNHHAHLHPQYQPSRRLPPTNPASMRRRVQSPNRRDFKDFSSHAREFRSPVKSVHNRAYLDEDEDSGADSLGNDISSCASHNRCGCRHSGNAQGTGTNLMALIPFESGSCCSRNHHGCYSNWACRGNQGVNYPVQTIPGLEERLLQLEGDKDSLNLQVALLSDQLESQTDKITDLEKNLDHKKDALRKTEDVLQHEMLTRSSLETKKLELLSEISSLKLRQAAVETENSDLKKKLGQVLSVPEEFHQPKQHLVDTILTLPPTGKGGFPLVCPPQSKNNTLQTFGTMPRRSKRRGDRLITSVPLETHFNHEEPDDSWFDKKIHGGHSGSAPSLALHGANTIPRTARHQSVERTLIQYTSPNSSGTQAPIATKPKGLKKILGRMRRANSGNHLHEDKKRDESGHDSLRRGGFRASAGSRFASWMTTTNNVSYPDPNLPFRQWKVDTICSWLDNLGLYMYNAEIRKHIKIGEQLLAMSSHDLEAKFGIKSSLHRKKILLALQAKQEPGSMQDLPGRLDHQWVVRWLDDVGLPQYKDAFLEARIDGRVLNLLTIEDLFHLKVTNLLHHLSLKRGIQVLRQSNFEPACLKRRASPEEKDRNSLPMEVSFWTNHRVMEWLRHVDLSEYAPNLRGSGVHGGLLVYEPRFGAELLASLLSIPGSKTLLRRHLSLHFRDLVGRDIMQEKRDFEDGPNTQVLTPTAKVKPTKRSQFSLRRRKFKADELDFEDLLCSLEENESGH
eukprot:snap_masked-scaffold342_size201858-processed-gene-1.3 protein:Tk00014 transcript:snap_masked-scaffold342_size201858-processed-gene-1.3-mRNA-1 annotation:"hypothetical protein D910_10177"